MAQAEAVVQRLCRGGYRQIGLDHFAKPDDEMAKALAEGRLKRNFQGYTTDPAGVLLGFGASAIGSLSAGYVQNAVPIRTYGAAIRNGQLAATRGIALGAEDRVRRAIIERLMCDLSVDLKMIARMYDTTLEAFSDETSALVLMKGDGLVDIEDTQIRVTARGRPFLRSVAAIFDSYLKPDAISHTPPV